MGSLCNKKPQKKPQTEQLDVPQTKKFGIGGPPSLRTAVIEMDFTEMKTEEEIVNTLTGSNFHFFLRKNHNFKPALEKVKPPNDISIMTSARFIFEHCLKEEQNNDAYGPYFFPLVEIFALLKSQLLPLIKRYEAECPDDKLNRSLMTSCLQCSSNTYQILFFLKNQTDGNENEKWWTYISKTKTSNHIVALKEEYNDLIPQLKKELPAQGTSGVRNLRAISLKEQDHTANAKKDAEGFVQNVFKGAAGSKEYEERFNERMDRDLIEIQDDGKNQKFEVNNYKMNPLRSK